MNVPHVLLAVLLGSIANSAFPIAAGSAPLVADIPGSISTAADSAPAVRPETSRTFAEPLVALGPVPKLETSELAAAVLQYRATGDIENVQPFRAFLTRYPNSSWRPSLLANLAVLYRHTGYLDRALASAHDAWTLTSELPDPAARKIADQALAVTVEITASLGRTDELAALLDSLRNRPLTGHTAETVSGARASLWEMRHDPRGSFRCGPLALERVSEILRPGRGPDAHLLPYPSTSRGTSLAEIARLARTSGLDLRAIRRLPGSPIPVPAVVHWKADHFAAIVESRGDRFLVKDLTFGDDRWISRRAVEEESSGYLLAAVGKVPPSGWRLLSDREAATIHGQGATANPNPGATTPDDPKNPTCDGGSGGSGMPHYNFHVAVVSLNVTDSPVGYQPPRGPAMRFGVTYNSREDFQPATFTYTNLGGRWEFDWLSYIEDDDPNNAGQTIRLAERGGGSYILPHLTAGGFATYGPNVRGAHDTITRTLQGTATTGFVRTYPNGAQDLYTQSDNAATMRKYFLTAVVDPAGNTVTLGYDTSIPIRLSTITDALGQTTTLSYGLSGDPYKVTSVTDPFGRQAILQYSAGELQSITDAVGMTSTFAYGPAAYDNQLAADFMSAMTTPYGTTTFDMGDTPEQPGDQRWLLATNPLGNQERVEFLNNASGIVSPTTQPVPTGFTNTNLQYRNSFFWNASAMQQYDAGDPNRYLNATYLFHWLHDGTGSVVAASSVPESVQAQGESRVWYAYPGQPQAQYQGALSTPTTVARVLDTGQQQVFGTTYDRSGRLQTYVDPAGRAYSLQYAPNGIDISSIRNNSLDGGLGEQIMAATYNSQHLPTAITDYSGQLTSLTYNGFGQPTSVTRPDGVQTTLTYNGQGFLTQTARPGTAWTETYTYDTANRIHTWTSTDGYVLTFAYDNLDRMTGITYPDGTSEQALFDRLDVVQYEDRMGRITSYTYDPADRLATATDPAGRTTSYSWCSCGALSQVTDPLGHPTSWVLDGLNRVVAKEINGQVATLYDYDGAGRLVRRTDALNQMATYSYTVDDRLAAINYLNTVHPTPTVQYQYDFFYPRLLGMTDGLGTTAYSYYPAGVVGAGRVAAITSPAPTHTIAFQYDVVGRAISTTLDGINQTIAYDAEDRTASMTNPLGTFNVSYGDSSNRPSAISYPNGQGLTLTYLDNLHDRRIAEMRWGAAGSFNLSQFDYAYDSAHDQITGLTWHDVSNPAGAFFSFAYDGAKQLLSRLQTTNPTQTPVTTLHTHSYGYDGAGNRSSETLDGSAAVATFDAANQLIVIERGLAGQVHAAMDQARTAGSSRQSGTSRSNPENAPAATEVRHER